MKKLVKTLEETKILALELAKNARPNLFFLLSGDLGVGKTTFTKYLIQSLGVKESITSPTFVLLNQYHTPALTINHLDAYRLTKNDNAEMLIEEFDDAFNVIEWSENLNFDFEQVAYYKIKIKIIDENTREFTIEKKDY